MFEFFFKYPFEAFANGDVVLLGRWPVWLLGSSCCSIGAGAFAWPMLRSRAFDATSAGRRVAAADRDARHAAADALAAGAERRDLASAAEHRRRRGGRFAEHGRRRITALSGEDALLQTLNQIKGSRQEVSSATLPCGSRAGANRVVRAAECAGSSDPHRRGAQAGYSEAGSLPIGAVVLLSDGADNSGGIDLADAQRNPPLSNSDPYRRLRREKMERDIEIMDVQTAYPGTGRLAARRPGHASKRYGYENRKARINIKDGRQDACHPRSHAEGGWQGTDRSRSLQRRRCGHQESSSDG